MDASRAVAEWDVDQSRSLSAGEFAAALEGLGVRLSAGECRMVSQY